ncbi:serpin family protein [Anaerobacillus sp. CMMVII]|uniref:serpin family protein n=1 Tax=Anaerobacillus sp. CMMVII TaxID=2755588 RepID=UPI0021B70581|nr:serpin family protein [Anaerobacillus sp. CMMVII]MCT8140460.1 serpin family protein [Anaerobacillus sp. CMMVII]
MIKMILLLIISSLLVSCGQINSELKPTLSFTNEDVHNEVVTNTNEFAFQLLKSLKERDESILISPFSISLALAMTVNGADGDTKTAMIEAMQQTSVPLEEINQSFQALMNIMTNADPKVQLSIANSLWGREDKNFYEDFVATNKDFYDAKLTLLDFQAADAVETINKWVNQETSGKIEKIIEDPIDHDTVLFLVNAIYFKGDWKLPFSKNRTVDKPFFTKDGKQQTVKMMSNEGAFQYFDKNGLQGIRLPYGDGRFAMDLFLPTQSMDQFLENTTKDEWLKWMTSFQTMNGYLEMPRFSLEYENSLVEVLKTFGMEVAFDEHKANLSKIAPVPPNLYISEVLHKTFIDVNEEGAEAAAVTSVEVKEESAPMYDFYMEVNRPFLYVIHDTETQAILFIGVTEEINE